ncbi:MAG TPA: hypothetical protein VN956_15755 [Pyrinomonadaceae bacterium]|nr:hypothetical protein [Pyrinomonadaceae bacterium]
MNDDGKSRTIDGLETNGALLDPLGWTAGPRRYRSGFCTQGTGDFIPGVVRPGQILNMMMTESRERSMAWKRARALLDPLGWTAGPRRYRSGFSTQGAGDFIPGVVATGSNTQHE